MPTLFGEEHTLPFGKAVQLKKGADITIISSGMMTHKALDAAKQLEAQGVSVNLLHMPFIKPLDKEAIIEAAQATKAIVTVEEPFGDRWAGQRRMRSGRGGGHSLRVHRIGFADIFLESGDDEGAVYEIRYEYRRHCTEG